MTNKIEIGAVNHKLLVNVKYINIYKSLFNNLMC